MFEKMKGMMDQLSAMKTLMADENFRAFISHPKVQELFKDPTFKDIAKTQDFMKIVQHSRFAEIMCDPEVAALMAKINPQSIMQR